MVARAQQSRIGREQRRAPVHVPPRRSRTPPVPAIDNREYLHLKGESLAELRADPHILDGMNGAVMLLDGELQVIYANGPAMALLDVGDGLGLWQRRLVARHPDDNSELQAALRPPPCPGQWAAEDFAVARRPERRPLLIRATRLAPPRENGPLPGPAWVVKISDPERRRRPDPQVLQELFGLTPAEAGVVLEMLPPRSEDEAARHRGVAKATFRAQLHAAYGKLGVNGRDELIHLLASYGFR